MSTIHEKASAEAEKRWPTLTMLIGQQTLQHFVLQDAFLQGAQWGVEETVNWINERGEQA